MNEVCFFGGLQCVCLNAKQDILLGNDATACYFTATQQPISCFFFTKHAG